MLQCTHSARGDDRHGHGVTDGARQFEIETGLGAVTVHAGQQDLAGPERGHLDGPGHGIQPGVLAPAVGVDIPAGAACGEIVALAALGVDGYHDALGTVAVRGITDDLGLRHGRGVEAHLVGPGVQEAAHVLDAAHPAAHRERDEDLRGHGLDDVQDEVTPVGSGRDVQKGKLVRALLVVARSDLHRVSGVAQFDEVHALDHAAAGHVQTGNDALGQHGRGFGRRRCGAADAQPGGSGRRLKRLSRRRVRPPVPARRRNPARRCRWSGRR